jgi:hypothetical protein
MSGVLTKQASTQSTQFLTSLKDLNFIKYLTLKNNQASPTTAQIYYERPINYLLKML